jgi:hypothetical protein
MGEGRISVNVTREDAQGSRLLAAESYEVHRGRIVFRRTSRPHEEIRQRSPVRRHVRHWPSLLSLFTVRLQDLALSGPRQRVIGSARSGHLRVRDQTPPLTARLGRELQLRKSGDRTWVGNTHGAAANAAGASTAR